MGRIAEQAASDDDAEPLLKPNKVDRILAELDDDEDRAIVLGWLNSKMSDEDVELRMFQYDIQCSDSTIRRWRRLRRRAGEWAA